MSYTPPLNWITVWATVITSAKCWFRRRNLLLSLWGGSSCSASVSHCRVPSALPAHIPTCFSSCLSDSHPVVRLGSGARAGVSLLLLHQKSALSSPAAFWVDEGIEELSSLCLGERSEIIVEVTGGGLEKANLMPRGPEDIMANGSYYLLWSSQSVSHNNKGWVWGDIMELGSTFAQLRGHWVWLEGR